MIERRVIKVSGVVQGVGFRPFVFGLASALDLRGRVWNDAAGVSIDVEGDSQAIDCLIEQMVSDPPPLASIEAISTADARLIPFQDLQIAESCVEGTRDALVSVDAATCDDCLRELFDPRDRRYRYPFITCTHCGPRLTIARGVPYDRSRTTMSSFAMCQTCAMEYSDPSNRRFHAQPISCWHCGPTLRFHSNVHGGGEGEEGTPAIASAVAALKRGEIVAIKGLGGFHLACDATDVDAVRKLRQSKHRDAKPFAIMVRDVESARTLCEVSDAEATLLLGSMHPIVLLAKRDAQDRPSVAVEAIAPRNRYLGVMLPYTPIHQLLLGDTGHPLVMTSGNRADEPIAIDDADACARLGSIAAAFLTHDRPIATRCDDSVTRVVRGAPTFIRRSRGAAPSTITLAEAVRSPVLAVGGHLKNTFCFVAGRRALLSHHIGDLENCDAFVALREGLSSYRRLFDIEPAIVAHDLHPDYLSTRLASEIVGVEQVGVQHHHAHVASCLAEHGQTGPVIGVVFDGAGLGADGAAWGGEFLLADTAGYARLAHIAYVGLPGGDAAAREPWRMAASHLWSAYGAEMRSLPLPFHDVIDVRQWTVLSQMLERGTRCPPTSSVGRLFDAVASLLGIRHMAQFEAQAAMELEMIADRSEPGAYPVEVRESGDAWIVDTAPLIRDVMKDVVRRRPAGSIAGAFHNAVAELTLDVAQRIRRRTGVRRSVLSGGVFQNVLLAERIAGALERADFEVLMHRRVPCNDGGLALGQAVIAGSARLATLRHEPTLEALCA